MILEVGQRIGDYEVLDVLGAGGMGQVYRVRNRLSDRIEAMKVLLPHCTAESDTLVRFMAEIRTLASFTHPNIAQLRTAFQIDNRLVMIMELVDGMTVEHRTKLGQIPQDEALGYVQQTLSALNYVHARGVIHRDIKPSNLMLTPKGVVKLMDFGLCKSEIGAQLTRPGVTVGSIHYMSPEQMRGGTVDARSDLYSVGIVLYELLAGHRPFETNGVCSVAHQQLNLPPRPPIEINPLIPRALNDLVLRSLAKEPAKRFQSANAFSKALSFLPTHSPQSSQVQPHASTRLATPVRFVSPRVSDKVASPARTATAVAQHRRRAGSEAPAGKGFVTPGKPSFGRRLGWVALGALAVVALAVAALELPYLVKANTAATGSSLNDSLSQPGERMTAPVEPGASDTNMAMAHEKMQELQSRANALHARINKRKGSQIVDGSNSPLRIDSEYERMHSHLEAAAKDLDSGDIDASRREMQKADKELSRLETIFNNQ